jgi:glycerol-3-phosphate acyltransferase PlsY
MAFYVNGGGVAKAFFSLVLPPERPMVLYSLTAVTAYFLGSIPFGYLLVKIFRGEDIRLTGSGNIGATNVARSGAKGLGAATLVLDVSKGLLAVGLAWALARSSFNLCRDDTRYVSLPCVPVLRLMAVAATSAVLGHIFPIWLKFRGGKGVATALGVFAMLFPQAVLVSLSLFVIALGLWRYVSLGSILAALSFPLAAYFLYRPDWPSLSLVATIAAIVVAKHHQNIRRLIEGNENRFGGKKKSEPPSRAEKSA